MNRNNARVVRRAVGGARIRHGGQGHPRCVHRCRADAIAKPGHAYMDNGDDYEGAGEGTAGNGRRPQLWITASPTGFAVPVSSTPAPRARPSGSGDGSSVNDPNT